jgi:hypothetical protein
MLRPLTSDAHIERVEGELGRKSAAALRALADHVASDEFLAAYESARANGPAASTK